LAGVVGGDLAITPLVEAGDSVIRPIENFSDSVSFPTGQSASEFISDNVVILIT